MAKNRNSGIDFNEFISSGGQKEQWGQAFVRSIPAGEVVMVPEHGTIANRYQVVMKAAKVLGIEVRVRRIDGELYAAVLPHEGLPHALDAAEQTA